MEEDGSQRLQMCCGLEVYHVMHKSVTAQMCPMQHFGREQAFLCLAQNFKGI